jgi:hypothetical protein
VAQDAAAKLVGQPAHFSWGGLVANTLASGVASEFGPTQQEVRAGYSASASQIGSAVLVQDVVQRETSVALGDNHVQSWKSIGENAVGNYVGAALGNALSPSAFDQQQAALEGKVSQGINGEIAGVNASIEGDTEASLRGYFAAANGAVDGQLDAALTQPSNGGGYAPYGGSYGNVAQAAGTAHPGALYTSAPDTSLNRYLVDPTNQGVFGAESYHSTGSYGLTPTADGYPGPGSTLDGYGGLRTASEPFQLVPRSTWDLEGVTVTANAPGVARADYDPAWSAFTDSSRGPSAFDEAGFTATSSFKAMQEKSNLAQADYNAKHPVEPAHVRQFQATASPVPETEASRMYQSAQEYAQVSPEFRAMFPLEAAVRQIPAAVLNYAGNLSAAYDGQDTKDRTGFDAERTRLRNSRGGAPRTKTRA